MKNYDKVIDELHSVEEVIKVHKGLYGLTSEKDLDYQRIEKGFLRDIILRDWCQRKPYQYEEGIIEFLNSKYLSDYMKEEIKRIIPDIKIPEENFGEMTTDELDKIREKIRIYYCFHDEEEDENLATFFDHYLMKLKGKGPKKLILERFKKARISSMILISSGLFSEGSYYSGEKVNRSELNENHLLSIYQKVKELNEQGAEELIQMIDEINTLNARYFVDAFKRFVKNDFTYSESILPKEDTKEDIYLAEDYTSKEKAIFAYNEMMTREVKEEFHKKLRKQEEKSKPKVHTLNCQIQ